MQGKKIDLTDYVNLMYDCIRKAGVTDEDVTSDILTITVDRINRTRTYDPERGAVTTWLPWVMRSVISNYFRDQKTSNDAMDQGTVPLDRLTNKMDERYDFRIEVLHVIQDSRLHNKDKILLYLKWNDGFNLKEISERLGISHDAARQQYSRAVRQLKEEYEEGIEALS